MDSLTPQELQVKRWTQACGLALLILGLTVILGWVSGIFWLTTLFPGTRSIAFNSALCFALTGMGLLAGTAHMRVAARSIAVVVGLFSLATFLQYPLGKSFNLDQLFWPASASSHSPFPGRMALNTSFAFILSSIALALLVCPKKRWFRSLAALGGALLGMVVVVFLGYGAGLDPDSALGTYTMANPTAVGFGVFSLLLMIRTWNEKDEHTLAIPLGTTALTLVISLGLISLHNNDFLIHANGLIRHTYQVHEQLNRVVLDLNVADVADRQFNAIADETFARNLQAAGEQIKWDVEALLDLVSDNPEQTARGIPLRGLIATKLDYLDEIFALRRQQQPSPEERAQQIRISLERSNAISEVINEMLVEENRLLQIRTGISENVAMLTRRLLILGSIVAAALVCTAVGLFAFSEEDRRKARSDLLRRNSELREATAAAHDSTRIKAQFLANMSHEIRTPMNGVLGMISLLLDTRLSTEQRTLANTVRLSADTLLTVINDILDFSKIEAGQLTFESNPFELREPVENCLGLIAEAAHRKRLELAYLIDENVPTRLVGDAHRLHQVLLNLVGNAVKFTSEGEVVVRVAKVSEENRKARLRFSVTDTGLGIPLDAQGKLFQPFTQVDGSTARKFGGTGLGLAICRQLVQLMGGEIGLESSPGKGSTFWFIAEFPLQEAEVTFVQHKAELAGQRALIVDDNETNREILFRQLKAWLVEPEAVSDGPSALERLKSAARSGQPFQFVVLDMQMPGMDGLELAQKIRADPSLNFPKLLMLTSIGQRTVPSELTQANGGAYLVKPARHSQLHDTLVTLLAGSTALSGTTAKTLMGPPVSMPLTSADINLQILVAEDNLVNQHVARMHLEKFGYHPVIVSDGLQAVAAVHAHSFDIILMDWQMPELDGLGATRQIRAREIERRAAGENFVPVYIIAMTANAMEGDRNSCLAAGMNDYLSKPLRKDELARALVRAPAAHK